MLLHAFTDAGVTYEVCLHRVDSQWFASLDIAGGGHRRPLRPFPDEISADLSFSAIRSGFIAAAEWLVKTGRWPDAESRSLHAERASVALAA